MAQGLKRLAVKAQGMNSMPGIHMTEGETIPARCRNKHLSKKREALPCKATRQVLVCTKSCFGPSPFVSLCLQGLEPGEFTLSLSCFLTHDTTNSAVALLEVHTSAPFPALCLP